MRPAARRATKTAHGRPPLSFAPARRRLAPLWPVEAPIPAPCGRCRKRSSWPGSTPIPGGRRPSAMSACGRSSRISGRGREDPVGPAKDRAYQS